MSWIRLFRGGVPGIVLVVALLAVGTAAAVTIQGEAPPPAEVGESVETTVTIDEPFRDAPDQWTLQGSTALENASWTVQVTAQGDPVDTIDAGGQEFTYDLDSETGATEVEITVRGDVPELSSFNYEEMSAENYSAVTVSRVADGTMTKLESFRAHRYTEESRQARDAIDSAIEAIGGTNDRIEQAIRAYNNGNFEDGINLANEAVEGGEQSVGNTPQPEEESTEYHRGFFTNDPESGFTVLNNPLNLTTIGFALSIVGILLELRRGG